GQTLWALTGYRHRRGDADALPDRDILPEDAGPVRLRARREPDAGRAAEQPRLPGGREVRPLVLEWYGGHHAVPHPAEERRPRRRDGRLLRRGLSHLHANHEQLRDRIDIRRPPRPRRRRGRIPIGDPDALDGVPDEPPDEGR